MLKTLDKLLIGLLFTISLMESFKGNYEVGTYCICFATFLTVLEVATA